VPGYPVAIDFPWRHRYAKHILAEHIIMNTPPRRAWPKAILFDLDDTLWPIAPVIRQAESSLHQWITDHAPRVSERFSIEHMRQARLSLLASQPEFHLDLGALRRAGLVTAFEEAGEDIDKVEQAMIHFFAARNAVIPYDDVIPGLLRLKGRVKLGTVSNGNADLQAIGLAHHFGASIAAHHFGCAKPDAAIFLAACEALAVAPHEAVYVGDDVLLDVKGAQQAGLRAVWLNRNASTSHLEHGVVPDAICANFDELLAWLKREHAAT
jgi:HAD superfamily hydrolase (TIGR01549 family)